MGERTCVIDGCEYKGQLRRGLCPQHYRQWKNADRNRPRCSINGCARSSYTKGYCERHYNRFRLYGDPEAPPQPRPQYATTGRTLHSSGYALVRVGPGDWQYEHRHVWEQAHGPIPAGHHIHHKNGIRDDNRLANLELINGARHNREHTTERHEDGSLNNRGRRSGRWRHDLDDTEIVRRRDSGETFRSIAASMGAAHNTISTHYRRTKEVMAS